MVLSAILTLPTSIIFGRFGFPRTASCCAMKYVELPDWYADAIVFDRALRLLLALKGKAAYINKTMCVYRKHDANLTNHRPHTLVRKYAELYRNVYHYSGKRHYKVARGAVNRAIHAERMQIHEETKGWKKFKALCSNTLYAFREFRIVHPKDLLRFPWHYLFLRDMTVFAKNLLPGNKQVPDVEPPQGM
jgi:hypothetical protein